MCGRSRCALAPDAVAAAAGTPRWEGRDQYHPSHNVTPGASTPVVRLDPGGGRLLHTMRWGLIPSFTKKGATPDFWRMFNARSESAGELPSFRRLLPTRRCVVWVNGFYEWKKEGKAKQPYYIYLAADGEALERGESGGKGDADDGGERPMALAGLWDTWEGAGDGEPPLYTYTILTTDACKPLRWLHDRMPVILPDATAQAVWLGDAPPGAPKLQSVMGPYAGADLRWRAVTKEMSNPKFQSPEAAAPLRRPSASEFFKPRGQAVGRSPEAVVKKEEAHEGAGAGVKMEEAAGPAPTPNADEPASPAAGVKKEPADREGQGTPGGTGVKRKEAPSPAQTPSSTKKKPKERPPGQPDISKFFGKR